MYFFIRLLIAAACITALPIAAQSQGLPVPFPSEIDLDPSPPEIDPDRITLPITRSDYMALWIKDRSNWRLAASNDPARRNSISRGCPDRRSPPSVRAVRDYLSNPDISSGRMRLITSDVTGAFYYTPAEAASGDRSGKLSIFGLAYGAPAPFSTAVIGHMWEGASDTLQIDRHNGGAIDYSPTGDLEGRTFRSRYYPGGVPRGAWIVDNRSPSTLSPFMPSEIRIEQGLATLIETRGIGSEPLVMMTSLGEDVGLPSTERVRVIEVLLLPVTLCGEVPAG